MANEAMIENWDGPGGEKWVRDAEGFDRALAAYLGRVVDAAAVADGERVLDVGCGNGALALALARQGARVTGVDISGAMLGEAGRRASEAGLDVDFVKADAQVHEFEPGAFDVVVSRFGVMFFDDPTAAFANIGKGVAPGGRMAFACWQELPKNEWLMVPAAAALAHVPMPELGPPGAPGPFAFADADRLRSILTDAGWTDVGFEEAAEAMVMGESVEDVMTFFRESEMGSILFKEVAPDVAERAWAAVEEAVQPHVRDDGSVAFQGVGWIVTARRP